MEGVVVKTEKQSEQILVTPPGVKVEQGSTEKGTVSVLDERSTASSVGREDKQDTNEKSGRNTTDEKDSSRERSNHKEKDKDRDKERERQKERERENYLYNRERDRSRLRPGEKGQDIRDRSREKEVGGNRSIPAREDEIPNSTTKIVIGGLEKTLTQTQLEQYLAEASLEGLGLVILVMHPKHLDRNRGFAFLEFTSPETAQAAYNKMTQKGFFLRGVKSFRVGWKQQDKVIENIEEIKSVYVSNLPKTMTTEEFRTLFEEFGVVEYAVLSGDLSKDGHQRRKDWGVVYFAERASALAAIKMRHGHVLENRRIMVSLSKSDVTKRTEGPVKIGNYGIKETPLDPATGKGGTIKCLVCHTELNCESQYIQHLEGKKHLRNVMLDQEAKRTARYHYKYKRSEYRDNNTDRSYDRREHTRDREKPTYGANNTAEKSVKESTDGRSDTAQDSEIQNSTVKKAGQGHGERSRAGKINPNNAMPRIYRGGRWENFRPSFRGGFFPRGPYRPSIEMGRGGAGMDFGGGMRGIRPGRPFFRGRGALWNRPPRGGMDGPGNRKRPLEIANQGVGFIRNPRRRLVPNAPALQPWQFSRRAPPSYEYEKYEDPYYYTDDGAGYEYDEGSYEYYIGDEYPEEEYEAYEYYDDGEEGGSDYPIEEDVGPVHTPQYDPSPHCPPPAGRRQGPPPPQLPPPSRQMPRGADSRERALYHPRGSPAPRAQPTRQPVHHSPLPHRGSHHGPRPQYTPQRTPRGAPVSHASYASSSHNPPPAPSGEEYYPAAATTHDVYPPSLPPAYGQPSSPQRVYDPYTQNRPLPHTVYSSSSPAHAAQPSLSQSQPQPTPATQPSQSAQHDHVQNSHPQPLPPSQTPQTAQLSYIPLQYSVDTSGNTYATPLPSHYPYALTSPGLLPTPQMTYIPAEVRLSYPYSGAPPVSPSTWHQPQ